MNKMLVVVIALLLVVVGVFWYMDDDDPAKTTTPPPIGPKEPTPPPPIGPKEPTPPPPIGPKKPTTPPPIGPKKPTTPIGWIEDKPSENLKTPRIEGDDVEIDPTVLKEFYPKGRKGTSLARFNIKGIGTNVDWGFKGETHFEHIYRLQSSVAVESNDGSTIVFVVDFGTIDQTVVYSKQTFQLELPDSPILDWALNNEALWTGILIAAGASPDVIAKGLIAMKALFIADPNLEITLTELAKLLGIETDMQFINSFDRLGNSKIRVTYTNGWGVTRIQALKSQVKLTDSELLALSDRLGLLTDYAIIKGKLRDVGETWTVDVKKIASLFAIGFDAETSGNLILSLKEKKPVDGKEMDIILSDEGTVTVQGGGNDGFGSGQLSVKYGRIEYAREDRFTEKAAFEFDIDTLWHSKNHLLFKTENARQLEVKARYGAWKEK
jgi:hypothetical protein